MCGDCNDGNANISPQTVDKCDRIDNDCDGKIDADPFGSPSCSVCNDADGDSVEDCEGDCDDADPAVYLGAPEICDGKDNDCDMMVDIDPATNLNLCLSVDGGVRDGGPGSGQDASVGGDAGVDGEGENGEEAPTSRRSNFPVVVPVAERAPANSHPALGWGVLLLSAALLPFRRLKRGSVELLAIILTAVVASACTSFEISEEGLAGGLDAGTQLDDGGGQDAGGPDTGLGDAGTSTTGPLTQGACRLQTPDAIRAESLPENTFQLAVHKTAAVTSLSEVNGLAVDDDPFGVRAFAMAIPLDPAFDPEDPDVANQLYRSLCSAAFDSAYSPASPGFPNVWTSPLRQRFVEAWIPGRS